MAVQDGSGLLQAAHTAKQVGSWQCRNGMFEASFEASLLGSSESNVWQSGLPGRKDLSCPQASNTMAVFDGSGLPAGSPHTAKRCFVH